MNAPQLKPIPTIATRAKIYDMYQKLPVKRVRSAIQYAIDTVNEQNKVKYTKRVQVLGSKHIAIIVDELGNAPGYEVMEEV